MTSKKHKEPLFLNLLLNVVLPSLLFVKVGEWTGFSPTVSLLIALSPPVLYGLYDVIRYKKYNVFSIIGIISLLLTGGIGLFKLSGTMLALKEALVPFILGVIIIIMYQLGKPVLEILLGEVIDIQMVKERFAERNKSAMYVSTLRNATYGFALTFLFSTVMNFFLAVWIVTATPGTAEFNKQLGSMVALSYPVIAIPSMVGVAAVMIYFIKRITTHAELTIEELVQAP